MSTLNRRSFLRAVAATGAVTATAGWPAAALAATTTSRVDVRRYGNMQAALDAHVPLLIPAGVTVNYAGSLKCYPGTDLQVDGVLQKTNASGDGTRSAFLVNKSYSVGCDDLTIHGTGIIRAADQSKTGGLFGLVGNRMRFLDFTVNCWAGSRCMNLAGDDIYLSGLHISGSPRTINNGGIRYMGGDNFLAEDCHVESGDDALQFVPSAGPGDPMFNWTITNGTYRNCTGRSWAAKFMVCGLQNRSTTPMTASILDCTFDHCVGHGGNTGVRAQNVNSSGQIANMRLINGCAVDMSNPTAKLNGTSFLINGGTGGGVHGVHGEVTITGYPSSKPLKKIQGNSSNIDVYSHS